MMASDQNPDQINTEAVKNSRRKRSIALAIALAVVVVLFYALTIVKMGPGLFDRTL